MRINKIAKTLLATFLLFGAFTTTQAAAAEPTKAEKAAQIQYFDANDKPINSVAENSAPVKAAGGVSTMAVSSYVIGKATFSNFVWIKAGSTFYNPGPVDVEFGTRNKAAAIYAYNSAGTYMGKGVSYNQSGWVPFSFSHLPRGASYKFKFVSEGGDTVIVNGGRLYYNY
ncbi:hypothetical protein [Ectobacillus panaciterrae]|uniref:hypothetical protein n=1 Tax=Ectobacillus panaciterrae TaxID=363872 RepID=UPI000404AA18|nr:hypothetical protein [Ectobacillus panaciterrae]